MAQETRLPWNEMKKLYPDQRVAIVDFESDKYGRVTCGVVVAHGKSISDFPPPPTNRGMIALQYTGVSTLGDRRIPLGYPMHDLPSREIPAPSNQDHQRTVDHTGTSMTHDTKQTRENDTERHA